MLRTAVTCVVCHRLRVSGSFSDAGDAFICAECQADGKQFIETQNSVWADIAETSGASEGTDKPADL